MGERRGPPLEIRAWREGRISRDPGWIPRNTPLSTCVTPPKFVIPGHTQRAYWRRSAWKNDPSRPAFQGHSMSSEPTRIDRLPVISC